MTTTPTAPTATPLTTGGENILVSVVAPAYNEGDNIPDLVSELDSVLASDRLKAYQPSEIILVDDGSTDHTLHEIQTAARHYDRVRGIELAQNSGQSAALAAGIDAARGDIIITIDADLQNDPHDIPDLIHTLEAENYDCVSGRRISRNDPASKRIPSEIQTHLAKLTGPSIHDFGCTLKAYRQTALDDIQLYGEGHRYIPAKLHDHGYRVTEQPVNHRERQYGDTKYGAGRLIRGGVDLLFHWYWNRYSTRPLHIFGGLGLAATGLGGIIGAASLIQRYLFATPLNPRTPRLILIVLLITFGFQLLIFGVISEMLAKLHYTDKQPYRINNIYQ